LKQLSATGDIADVEARAVPQKLRRSSWSMTMPTSPFLNAMGSSSMSLAPGGRNGSARSSYSAESLPKISADFAAPAAQYSSFSQPGGCEREEDCLLSQLLQERSVYQAEADKLRREVTMLQNQLSLMRFQHGVAEEDEEALLEDYCDFGEEPDLPGLSYSTAASSGDEGI
jgi:hypothetical protein